MPVITINDQQIEVEKGTNVIEAAKKLGIDIPHYCYHPGLRIDGNCRMCMVEVKGPRGFMPSIACNTFCTDGLEVKTDTEQIKNIRQGVMEFLLHNHPIDCPICDQAGECRLQDYYMQHGKYDNRSIVEKVHKDKVVDIGPLVVLDQERCILCSRCVRFCEDVSKTSELVIVNRGVRSEIELFPGSKLDNKYSGNVVDICPVGALTSKDFRFKMRVWFMQSAKSVCHGCSRGCNIYTDYKDGTAYRFRPRANTEVNDYWICDEGRMSYKAINENRFLEPLLNGEQIEYSDAVNEFMNIIKQTKSRHTPKSVAAIVSPHSSVEDNFMLAKFMNKIVGSEQIFGADFKAPGYQDDFLIRADKTANKKGLEYLGIDIDKDSLINALKNKEIKLLIIMNNDIIGDAGEELGSLLEGVELISLSTHNTETVKSSKLAIPLSLYSEKYGSIVNFQGQLQKFDKAFESFDKEDSLAIPEWEFFANRLRDFDQDIQYFDIEDVWSEIRESVPVFSNISFFDIGENGINIPDKIEKEKQSAESAAVTETEITEPAPEK